MTGNAYISPQISFITIDERTAMMAQSKFVIYDENGDQIYIGEVVEGDPEDGVHLGKWQYKPLYSGWDIDENDNYIDNIIP